MRHRWSWLLMGVTIFCLWLPNQNNAVGADEVNQPRPANGAPARPNVRLTLSGDVRDGVLTYRTKTLDVASPGLTLAVPIGPARIERVVIEVTGKLPTRIDGVLDATKLSELWIVNPNGIEFGETARVSVGGSFAAVAQSSTAEVARLTVRGGIDVPSGATVRLVGERIEQMGTIHAPDGKIVVAAVTRPVDPRGEKFETHRTAHGGEAGILESTGTLDAVGGAVEIAAPLGFVGGTVTAGRIAVTGDNLVLHGALTAEDIGVTAGVRIIQTALGTATAGNITLNGGDSARNAGVFTSGTLDATGGGRVEVTGRRVDLVAATVRANGRDGGTIAIGEHSREVYVSEATKLSADASPVGQGGKVEIRSEKRTEFVGTASAVGGLVDVSGSGDVGADGTVTAGKFVLDPKNIVIDNAVGVFPQFDLVDPNPPVFTLLANQFQPLGNGRVVVTKPSDSFAGTNTGAVYLYDGFTGALISTMTGSTAEDSIGISITVLTNANFVISSPNWNATRGAATWGNGTTGLSGVVSAANSLVGNIVDDQVSLSGITALTNGNYVVGSRRWDRLSVDRAGAATWGNGTFGTAGTITPANSLVGISANDSVGEQIIPLPNGNYVVNSINWDNGTFTNAGAVTWGFGGGGTVGFVTASNSLVGSAQGDVVGGGGILVLTNGNYVVVSSTWRNGFLQSAGAVTWCNGTTGRIGPVSTSNSLVGGSSFDSIGAGSILGETNNIVLANGNYVIGSPGWDNGTAADAGAATWCDGTTGRVGVVDASNSLIGSTPNDKIGSSIMALTNGNYVVRSSAWDNGTTVNVGAATWANGATGITGAVNAGNSLIGGTAEDSVGSVGTALANGNYVIGCPGWDNGSVQNIGAATWCNGATGRTGLVTAANSLIGTRAGDLFFLRITALTNGDYVVVSPSWDNESNVVDVGAVTQGNGTTGTVGVIGGGNSLVGSQTGDGAGSGGVTPLTNGNYVVGSPNWDYGAISNAGAATWVNSSVGYIGTIVPFFSLTGTTAGDQVGTSVTPLSNGSYVVVSPQWNGNRGAATWVSGTTGRPVDGSSGVATSNSIVGFDTQPTLATVKDDTQPNSTFLVSFSTGRIAVGVGVLDPNLLTFGRGQSKTMTVRSEFLTQLLNAGTAVTLQANNDITVNAGGITTTGNGALTLQAGRSIALNAAITLANGNLTLIANDISANGVVDAQRDPGAATIAATATAPIDVGSGTVSVQLRDGAGKTNRTSGDISLFTVRGGQITLSNTGPTAGSRIRVTGTLAGGCAGASLCTSGVGGGGITIQHPNSGANFIVGNATTNGTAGSIITGSATVPVTTTIVNAPGTFTQGNISVTPGASSPAPAIGQFYPVASMSGKTIAIVGSGFVPGSTQVFFGGAALIPATISTVTSTQIQVVVPASSASSNINGYITVQVGTAGVTSQSLPANATNPGDPGATFPEFVLWGDANGDGVFNGVDVTISRAMFLGQIAAPTPRQRLALDVNPANANGSRGDGTFNGIDVTLLRAIFLGQIVF